MNKHFFHRILNISILLLLLGVLFFALVYDTGNGTRGASVEEYIQVFAFLLGVPLLILLLIIKLIVYLVGRRRTKKDK